MLPCWTCGRHAFLIGTCCDACDPRAHREFRERMDFVDKVDAHYRRETGKRPLEDWAAFERWCEDYGIPNRRLTGGRTWRRF